MFQLLVIIPYVERFGAGMLLMLCVLLSEWCVRFGVGMLVPLQDAAAGCCCRIFLRSSRRRSVARGEWLQRKELTKHKFWSCKCTKVQNREVWGMIRAWFGVWFGNPLFLNSGSFVAWVSFSHRQPTTIATYWLQWLNLPDDLGQDLNMKTVKI